MRVGRSRAGAAMKKLLIVFLLLLLLGGGGGAAAWWFYFRAPEVAEDEGPAAPQLSQVELDTIPITVLRNGKPTYQFFFRIVLMFDDPLKMEQVQYNLPAVYDAVTMELHQLLSRKQMEQNGFEEPLIRQRLDKAIKARIGQDKIYKVSIRAMERMDLK
jgi:flagellar basal body-associated protein FliL